MRIACAYLAVLASSLFPVPAVAQVSISRPLDLDTIDVQRLALRLVDRSQPLEAHERDFRHAFRIVRDADQQARGFTIATQLVAALDQPQDEFSLSETLNLLAVGSNVHDEWHPLVGGTFARLVTDQDPANYIMALEVAARLPEPVREMLVGPTRSLVIRELSADPERVAYLAVKLIMLGDLGREAFEGISDRLSPIALSLVRLQVKSL